MKTSTTLAASTLALFLVAAAAQAAPLFSYNWSPDTQKHFADGFGPGDTDHYVNFSNEPPKDASVNSVSHQTHLVATNLSVFSSADDATPDSINSNYGLTLVLQDLATGHSHTFSFTGKLSGTFSSGTSNIDNTFTGGPPATWTDTNGDTFKITMDAFAPPGPPNSILRGSIGTTVAYSTSSSTGGGNTGGGATGGRTPGRPGAVHPAAVVPGPHRPRRRIVAEAAGRPPRLSSERFFSFLQRH